MIEVLALAGAVAQIGGGISTALRQAETSTTYYRTLVNLGRSIVRSSWPSLGNTRAHSGVSLAPSKRA